MKPKQITNVEKPLEEKKAMQKAFTREYGYPSSVLTLLIDYFRGLQKRK